MASADKIADFTYPPIQAGFFHNEPRTPLSVPWVTWFNRIAVLSASGALSSATNLGDGVGIFESRSGANLQFYSFSEDSNTISVTLNGDSILLETIGTGIDHNTLLNYEADEHVPLPQTFNLGTVLRGNGVAYIESTFTFADTYNVSELLYASANNTIVGLTTANSSLLITNGSGVPAFGTDIPTAVTIGGQYVYRVGGTDVAVADGGTGQSSYTNGQLLIGNTTGNTLNKATLTASGLVGITNGAGSITVNVTQAGQLAMETATSLTDAVVPGVVQFHPGVAKAWVKFASSSTIQASYNVSSITDNGAGDFTITFSTAFSSANYAIVAMAGTNAVSAQSARTHTTGAAPTTTTSRILFGYVDSAGLIVPFDENYNSIVFYGDQ